MRESLQTKLRGVLSRRKKRVLNDLSLVPAAVLMLIYPKDGEPHVLFNERTELVEHHKGEVSFPGGAMDPEDPGPLEAALRETREEMGVAPRDVTILGELDETATYTGFAIHIFVGTILGGYDFRPNPAEIAQVIEVPLSALMAPESQRVETRWIEGRPEDSCCFVHRGHLIGGATASIVRQFLDVLEESGWKGTAGAF